jgi:hypothetical protein
MLTAFSHDAALFNADIELRRILLAKERKPLPFITIMEFGLHMQVDESPFPASPFECPSNSTGDIR